MSKYFNVNLEWTISGLCYLFLLPPLCKTSELTNLGHQLNFIFVELEKKRHWFYIYCFCYYRNTSLSDAQDIHHTKVAKWIGQEKNRKFWVNYREWFYCWNYWVNMFLGMCFSGHQRKWCFWSKKWWLYYSHILEFSKIFVAHLSIFQNVGDISRV